MRYFITTSLKASFLGVCLVGGVSLNALAITGSAITGDSAGGNPDSSTFTGDIFVPPSSSGGVDFSNNAGTVQGARRPRPKNWTCNLPFKNQESSLRFKTLATMLSTNLAGSDFLFGLLTPPVMTIQNSPNDKPQDVNGQPLFRCDNRLESLPPTEKSNNNNNNSNLNSTDSSTNIKPPSLCSSPSLFNYLGRPVPTIVTLEKIDQPKEKAEIVEKSTLAEVVLKANAIQTSLLKLLGLNPPPDLTQEQEFCGIYDKVVKEKEQEDPQQEKEYVIEDRPTKDVQALLVRDLVTTLFGLTWDKTLLGDAQGEALVDANQFAAAVKTYNELINLLDEKQLERWSLPPEQWSLSANTQSSSLMVVGRELTTEEKESMIALTPEEIAAGRRAAQDITATLKTMRSACNCGWENLWVDEPIPQSETIGSNIPSPKP